MNVWIRVSSGATQRRFALRIILASVAPRKSDSRLKVFLPQCRTCPSKQPDMLVVKYICMAAGGYSTANVSLAAQAEPASAAVLDHPSLDWVKAESLVDLF